MNKKSYDIIETLLIMGIVVFINIIAVRNFYRVDLTQDKHFSLASSTKKSLSALNQKIYVEVFLDGTLTPDYLRLKKAIKEKLEEFTIYSDGMVQYKFSNPNAIEDPKLRKQYASMLLSKGVEYRYERVDDDGKISEQLIFPSAIISSSSKEVPVMFLKGNKSAPLPEQINQSEEEVEYQLLTAFRQIQAQITQNIGIVEGHGELAPENLSDITATLSNYYHLNRLNLSDSLDLSKYDLLLIAGSKMPYSEKEKFYLDQYVQRGGNVLMFVDPLNINTDSLMNSYTYALPTELNVNDLLFKWGIRCNPNAIKDLSSGLIKVATGNMGQMQTINWYFHPVIYNFGTSSIVKNLDAILTKYPASIDTVKAVGITKTPLLFSSEKTQIITAPTKIDLNEARQSPESNNYSSGRQVIAYLLEGNFSSLYNNRPSPVLGTAVVDDTVKSKIIICTDVDLIANETNNRSQRPIPLGFDRVTNYQFSNKEFVLNSVDYLMSHPLIELRNKEIKLRPLDRDKANQEKFFWQMLNLGLPPLLLILFGTLRYVWRRQKYNR